jgi:hypothetical protein
MKNTKLISNVLKILTVLFMLVSTSFVEAKTHHGKKKTASHHSAKSAKKLASKGSKKSNRLPASIKHKKKGKKKKGKRY